MEQVLATKEAGGEHEAAELHQGTLLDPGNSTANEKDGGKSGAREEGDAEATRSRTPQLEVTLQDDDKHINLQVTSSVSTEVGSARAVSPLLWSDGGWHAGHFHFIQEQAQGSTSKEQGSTSDEENKEGQGSANKGSSGRASPGSSTSSGHVKEEATPRLKSATIPIKTLHSNLTPTAAPFVFQPKSTAQDAPSPSSPLYPISTSSYSTMATMSSTQDLTAEPSSYAETAFDYLRGEEETDWRLDEDGHLVQVGGGDRYQIADEILQLQSVEVDAAPTTTSMGYGGRVHTKLPSYYDHSRRASESSVGSTSAQASSAPFHPRPQPPQIPFPSMPSFIPSTPPSTDRSRSSSISSQHSYFSARPSSTHERSPAVSQIHSYFGPSPVEVNSPYAAAYASAYDMAYSSMPPSPSALRDLAYPGGGLHHSASSSSLSSLGYQTDPEDILYQEARETFIQSSFAALSSTPTAANRQSMTEHFDRAMHSPYPLAVLYALTPDHATQLAADPARSGVPDNVLKLALIRGQQQRLAGAQGLGGPSANNRKLGLYKTELCRSWEEEGSCRYGAKCQFAHGPHEIREVARHPKFKSEVCRTFWLHGSCPYGRRCCFIHTTVPGGASAAPNGSAGAESLAPSSTALTSSAPLAGTKVESTSRIAHRMTSTSSLASATSSNGSRGFGPNLSSYLGPTSSPASSSPTSSYFNSPVEPLRHDFGASAFSSKGALNGSPYDSPIGLGLKLPGRFTTNPSEVPATYQDPPKSRLERLASLSRSNSSTDLASPFYGASNGSSSALGLSFSMSASASTTTVPAHHSRHSSQSSFSSFSSVGSSTHSSTYSPFLPRTDSGSSLSSFGGSPFVPFTPLKPAGDAWLGGPSSKSSKASILAWDSDLIDDESDTTFTSDMGQIDLNRSDINRSADDCTPVPTTGWKGEEH